jgi:hypothetical protein
MQRLKHPTATVLLFLGAAVAVEGISARPDAVAASAPPVVVPALGFTETYKAALKNTPAGGIAVETEHLLINATVPYSITDPAFTTQSPFHLNVGRFVFDGKLGDDPHYANGKKSARLVVSKEDTLDDLGHVVRTRVYATATLKWVVGRKGKPSKVLVKVTGARGNFQDVVGDPNLDFSVVTPGLWLPRLLDLEGGASADPTPVAGSFSVDAVVTVGTLSNAFAVTYAGTSNPKVKTIREIVDYDPDTDKPIYGQEKHFLADMKVDGTATLK